MPTLRFNFLNLILISLVAVILCGLQTTVWFQLFGGLPAPILWLNLVLYLILYRKPFEGIFTIYFLALFIKPFTATPVGMLWINFLTIFSLVIYAKKRLFWPTLRYFVIASAGTYVLFQISFLTYSNWIESNAAKINVYNFLFELIFTALTAGPVYYTLSWIDRITQKETLPESGLTES